MDRFNAEKKPKCFMTLVPAVADNDDRVVGIERDVIELGLLPRHDLLRADGMIFVDVKIKDVDLAVNGHGGENSAAPRLANFFDSK